MPIEPFSISPSVDNEVSAKREPDIVNDRLTSKYGVYSIAFDEVFSKIKPMGMASPVLYCSFMSSCNLMAGDGANVIVLVLTGSVDSDAYENPNMVTIMQKRAEVFMAS